MKIVRPRAEIVSDVKGDEIIREIEAYGRVCYKSEDKITNDSAEKFIRRILENGHESVLEHSRVTAKFVCDRGISHEIVRHRIASYSQESTRYCNYGNEKFGNEITVIEPFYLTHGSGAYAVWKHAMEVAEQSYLDMLQHGCTPQEARAVLPNSLKTEIIMSANLREWRHFFKMRTDKSAHPQMRQVAVMLLADFQKKIPVLFDEFGEHSQIEFAYCADMSVPLS